jgi:L-lactate dehydrogenase
VATRLGLCTGGGIVIPNVVGGGRVGAVGVVGAGAVGQAVTAALVASGMCARLLVSSRTHAQAAALAADLDDMSSALGSPVRPVAVYPADLLSCDALVVALRAEFVNTATSDVRMAGAAANGQSVAALANALRGYAGTVLVVTNPVDLMSRLFAEVCGCGRVWGVGSGLDSARYRLALARYLGVPPDAVRGHVIGEHGDAAVICASSTTVHGAPTPVPVRRMRAELAALPGRISSGIGRTRSGPAGAVLATLLLALGLADGVTELSASYRGGWLGVLVRFVAGHPTPCLPALDNTEASQLQTAHTKLHTAYQRLHHTQPELLPE